MDISNFNLSYHKKTLVIHQNNFSTSHNLKKGEFTSARNINNLIIQTIMLQIDNIVLLECFHQEIVVAQAAWKTDEAATSGGLAIVWSTLALLAAVALTSLYENVAAAYADCVTAVLIVGSATFAGSTTFSARHSNFSVENRGLLVWYSLHFVF